MLLGYVYPPAVNPQDSVLGEKEKNHQQVEQDLIVHGQGLSACMIL